MANGYLTTHVLDTARGRPAGGMEITLYRIEGTNRMKLVQMSTNADGRTDTPILPKGQFAAGTYELVFDAGGYLDAIGAEPEAPRFHLSRQLNVAAGCDVRARCLHCAAAPWHITCLIRQESAHVHACKHPDRTGPKPSATGD